ncbi:MAG: Asp-tRNA(Asn)/Glu-tRNA(Gln) amidotransferase subunit GatB [Clostridiaceae bacterium]|jgi:aspartyl-tRNA(Asn)/glutamyl-tRNA(Gln) amidotransferase subunit B|nr:Asp-tRNA(Asn)/Glu-tRNA(Gln) amidotransferase subunit GatB [Clostridiaceae bacterium]
MRKYTTVIGLEIHAELLTETKIFCACKNTFGDAENSSCCPVCIGLPGALPVINHRAVELTVAAGLSFGCEISRYTVWDRKNYFYPDLAKAYQISQLYAPLCIGGGVTVGGRFIRLNRIHLEEDAGKLIHSRGGVKIDYNRAGVPLIEIVTEPDLRSAEEATEFVERVRRTLVYAGVSDGKMEQGSLRVDANVSVMPEGTDVYGTRTEIKNINSFRFIKSAIEFEAARQSELIESGGRVVQETRRYDEASGETFSMRSKEDAHDYRYFPDPDILPLIITDADVEKIASGLDESPEKRLNRYAGYGISAIDCETVLANKIIADFFDAVVAGGIEPTEAVNAVKGELMRCFNAAENKDGLPVSAEDFIKGLKLVAEQKISRNGFKESVNHMFFERKSLDAVLEEYKLVIKEDRGLIDGAVAAVIAENPKALRQYKDGDQKVFGYFVGQCARLLKGAAQMSTIQAVLKEALDKA